jgi:hypothetical protein
VGLVLLAAVLSVACGERTVRPGTPPRHLLLVTVAGLGGGSETSFEAWAEVGVLFPWTFAPTPSTHGALASLFSGRPPLETAVLCDGDAPLSSGFLLVNSFARAGFATTARVTRGGAPFGPGWHAGFDSFLESETDAASVEQLRQDLAVRDLLGARPVFAWLHLEQPRHTGELLNAMFSELTDRGVFESCVIAFAGLGARESATETSGVLEDRSLRLPLCLRHTPSLTGRRIFGTIVELQDLAPTLLEWFGVEPSEDHGPIRGRSLLSILDEWRERPFPEVSAFAVAGTPDAPVLSARDTRWRMTWSPRGRAEGDGAPGREPQLFLADDPGDEGDEKQDRAAERPDVVRELRAELLAWLAQLELADAFVTLRDLR